MSDHIDWTHLAQQLRERGYHGYGSVQAMAALELIVGEDAIRDAVDHYVAYQPHYELARHVLWRLRPASAMRRCYEIFKSDADIEQRRSAVELLRVVADERVVPWIDEFLVDPDPGIQNWGIGVLDQLLWGGELSPDGRVSQEVDMLLQGAERHQNAGVRELATFIRGYLRRRAAADRGSEAENDNHD